MRQIFTIAVISAFLAIAVFGFFVMNKEGGHAGCIAERLNGGACPQNDPVAFANFHLEAVSNLLTAGFSKSFGAAVLFSFALFLLFGSRLIFGSNFSKKSIFPGVFYHRSLQNAFAYSKEPLNSWLASHENSPSLI